MVSASEVEEKRFFENKDKVLKLVEQFEIESQYFLRPNEIVDIVDLAIKKAGKGHKPGSKKHLAKLKGKVITEHRKARRTCVFIEIEVHKRRLAFDFHIVNYFKTNDGMVYVYRSGIDDNLMQFYTAHFFDRLHQRTYDDADGRTSVIYSFIKDFGKKGIGVGSHITGDGEFVLDCHIGIGLGFAAMIDKKQIHLVMNQEDPRVRPTKVKAFGDALPHPKVHEYGELRPDRLFVSFCMTYVSNEMLNDHQRLTIETLRSEKKAEYEKLVQERNANLEKEKDNERK